MKEERELTLDMTVNDAVRFVPGALETLAACGIDTCCGGALPLGEAARRHGLDVDRLMARLREDAGSAAGERSAAGQSEEVRLR